MTGPEALKKMFQVAPPEAIAYMAYLGHMADDPSEETVRGILDQTGMAEFNLVKRIFHEGGVSTFFKADQKYFEAEGAKL